jgi:hypothetical protein
MPDFDVFYNADPTSGVVWCGDLVDTVTADDAPAAFNAVLADPERPNFGQYRVYPKDGSATFTVEISVTEDPAE